MIETSGRLADPREQARGLRNHAKSTGRLTVALLALGFSIHLAVVSISAAEILLPVVAAPLVVDESTTEASSPAGASAARKALRTRSEPTLRLSGGQALSAMLEEKSLTIETRYGTLVVPLSEVVQIRLRPSLRPEAEEKFQELVKSLRAADEQGQDLSAFLDALRALGPGAFWSLDAAARDPDFESIHDELSTLTEELRGRSDLYVGENDEVATVRFTIRGSIVEDAFHVERFGTRLELPRSDVLEIVWGELEVRKVFKVGGEHAEGSNQHLDTELLLKKGQRFTLKPSGTMTWQGQTFGPAGISNHTWNSRKMGCLQWRVGEGAWTVLEGDFEGRSPANGTLQFCIHLTGAAGSGEFKVEFQSAKK